MSYRLRDDVSFCQIEDHLVFLDVQNDRYFRLSERTERALIAYMDDCGALAGLDALIDTGLLIEGQPRDGRIQATLLEGPSRSALEEESSNARVRIVVYLEVLWIVSSTRWRLKKQKLKRVIDTATAYRNSRLDALGSASSEPAEHDLLAAASLFRSARKHVPVGASCLLDSLALLQFLARRGLPSRLVFGITLEPFSAHCWVQAGTLALNETVGDANAHTPIRAV